MGKAAWALAAKTARSPVWRSWNRSTPPWASAMCPAFWEPFAAPAPQSPHTQRHCTAIPVGVRCEKGREADLAAGSKVAPNVVAEAGGRDGLAALATDLLPAPHLLPLLALVLLLLQRARA